MFFTLSSKPDSRLPNHEKFGVYWFSHDDGWEKHTNYWYKGYNYSEIDHGNFLKISLVSNNHIKLDHDVVRGFPLWWDSTTKTLTNLAGSGENVWSDRLLNFIDYNLQTELLESKYSHDLDYGLNIDQAADQICENLVAKAKCLKKYQKETPKKLFLTGGVDTAVLYSLLNYCNLKFETIDYEYIKYDQFLNNNLSLIKSQHWAYNQLHHWTDPTMLISGGFGDEYLFRGPTTIAIWAAWHDVDMIKILNSNNTGYHTEYFLKQKNAKIFCEYWRNRQSIKSQFPSTKDIASQLLNVNYNDYQHWHLGNTLTWTPFKDIELFKISLRLDPESAVNHFIDATLNKQVIKKLYPKALTLISESKNSNTARQNLTCSIYD